MSKISFVNTENLKTARENVGLDVFYVSQRISKSESKKNCVLLWETGQDLPTWKQIIKLAKIYNIPELSLVSKNNIRKNKEVPDFRVGISDDEKNEVKKLIDIVLKRQLWLELLYKKEGREKNKLLGSGKDINSPIDLADFISGKLNIDINEIKKISGYNASVKALKYLIEKSENQGIFVSKTISYHRIPVNQMRGLFISNEYCPFIVLNRQDAISAQIFSIVHELTHFFRRSDSISNVIDFRDINKDLNQEESFCNKVAANLLLPAKDFDRDFYVIDDIKKLSILYKVSELFVFYRLKDLGKIKKIDENKFEEEIKNRSEQNIASRKKSNGGNFNYNMMDSNGGLFNRTVVGCYFDNKIGAVEASNLLKFSVEVYEYK